MGSKGHSYFLSHSQSGVTLVSESRGHQYKMTILGDTVIARSDFRNDNHFLDLAMIEEIGNGKLESKFLIDLAMIEEIVTDLGAVATVQS
ncbi:hypothetical protein Bca101_083504 [Brassica carinata]